MSGLSERNETPSPSTTSDSSLSSEENDQASDDEELQQLLEQRSSSPSIKLSEEKLLSEFRSLYSETLNASSLEESSLQDDTEDHKKVLSYCPTCSTRDRRKLITHTPLIAWCLITRQVGT